MKTAARLLCAMLLVLPVAGLIDLRADEVASARQRIDGRLGAIAALKDRGVLGENNRGFVEARASLAEPDEAIVTAENRDRATVYAGVAEKTGRTPEQVGRARARRIAEHSRPGVWLQDEGGRWYRK